MRLVHRIEGNLHATQQADVLLLGKGFGGHIQDFRTSRGQIVAHLVNLLAAQRRIQEMRQGTVPCFETAEQVHLILHQGDEGGDDDRRSLHHQGRKLIAEGFSPAGGHQHEGIASADQVLDNALLVTFEGIVTKEILQLCPNLFLHLRTYG